MARMPAFLTNQTTEQKEIEQKNMSHVKNVKFEPFTWPCSPGSSLDGTTLECLGGNTIQSCQRLNFFSLSHACYMLIVTSLKFTHRA